MSDTGKVGTAPGRALRVLIVDDEVNDFELVLRELRRVGYDPSAQRVETESELRDCLLVDGWEIAIVDHSLPHFSSGPAVSILREHDPDLPVIIVSGVIDEKMAVDLMRAGGG